MKASCGALSALGKLMYFSWTGRRSMDLSRWATRKYWGCESLNSSPQVPTASRFSWWKWLDHCASAAGFSSSRQFGPAGLEHRRKSRRRSFLATYSTRAGSRVFMRSLRRRRVLNLNWATTAGCLITNLK